MSMHPERWEHGSDFDLSPHSAPEEIVHPWHAGSRSYASGRDAFHALLCHGRREQGWKRLLVPAYYCQQVVSSLAQSGLEIVLYDTSPLDTADRIDAPEAMAGDVLLAVNFFGLGTRPRYPRARAAGGVIIEDHTHDPWSRWAYASDADWCLVSLRKTLPVADGGILWSPRGHARLPSPPLSAARAEASSKRLSAMFMKRLYLDGRRVQKDDFRALYLECERVLAVPEASAMTAWSDAILQALPLRSMRRARRANFDVLAEQLRGQPGVTLMQPASGEDMCPFSCVLVFPSEERAARTKASLVAQGIYPAVLWPLERPVVQGIPPELRTLSRRLLSVHCDARYGESDMLRVAGRIQALLQDEQLTDEMRQADEI